VMNVLQLIEVCLITILWASAFFPILVSSSIHVCSSVGLVGSGGILGVWVNCNAIMFGLL
jgi:hypothetical protein